MRKRTPTLMDNLLRYWPIYGIGVTLCGAIVLWGGIPGRLAKAEEQIDDLKGWAKQTQGYTAALQQMIVQQQVAPPAAPAYPAPPAPPASPAGLQRTCFDDQWREKPCR